MKLNRRGFLGTVAAIPLALKLNPEKLKEKVKLIKPVYHPAHIPSEALPEGWYKVQVVNVFERESKKDGSLIYGLTLMTEKGTEVKSMFSGRALHAMVPALTACKLLNTDIVQLENAVGRQMRVHLTREEYKGKNHNMVDEYLALE